VRLDDAFDQGGEGRAVTDIAGVRFDGAAGSGGGGADFGGQFVERRL
jgi:hypothetical protein